ncbi:MAG TPA: zf-HC2 domain-containing protein [Bryobacteraceae bacterium]|nr:zf-HC2 domain-containing protein [Bryobacteraceae bacterium]
MEELSCKTVRPSLWDYSARLLDQPDYEAIDAHLDGCRDCDRYLADICSMRNGFRHLPSQPVPPLLQTKLQVIASRERSRQLLRLNPGAWLRDVLDRALLSFENFLRPYAVPAAGGLLTSCLCFSLIAHTLELRPYLLGEDMPIGFFSEVSLDDVSPFSFSGKDVTFEVTVDASGKVTDFSPLPGSQTTQQEMEEMGGWLLYSTFSPAMRSGQPIASRQLISIQHIRYQIDSRGIPHRD